MPKTLWIILAMAIVSMVSGGSLSALHNGTKERIEIQVLKNKQMPAVEKVLAMAENNLLEDRKTLELGPKDKHTIFPAKKGSSLFALALEHSGKGFGGDVGVMMGFELDSGKLSGIAITTMSETPGVGTRTREDSFTKQFTGLDSSAVFKVKADGGDIDAVTGATISSRAVCKAVTRGFEFYKEHKDEILKTVK